MGHHINISTKMYIYSCLPLFPLCNNINPKFRKILNLHLDLDKALVTLWNPCIIFKLLGTHLHCINLLLRGLGTQKKSTMNRHKPEPQAAMLHTCYGMFQRCCDASKLHLMCCDKKFKTPNFLLPILEYNTFLTIQFSYSL